MFIIYINDLPNFTNKLFPILFADDTTLLTNKLFPILFADDTTLLIKDSNIHDIIAMFNSELNSLNVWLGSNKLSINVWKTHYMVFHQARLKNNNNNIFLNNYDILLLP